MSSKPRIGFVGIGLMGHGIARNLVTKGYPLTLRVHRNRQAAADLLAAGAQEVDTNAALARDCDIVFICVTGAPQVDEVINGDLGLASAAHPGLIVVDTSTSEPSMTARLRDVLAMRGARLVDAPLSRTPKEAEEGRLNIMVGADDETFERLKPVLGAFCENIVHAGPPGHGHTLKLVNNFISLSFVASIAEALATAKKTGLSIDKLIELVSAGPVNNGIFQMVAGAAMRGDLTAMKFSLSNAMKDLRYYTHLAESLPTSAIMGEAAHQSYVNANLLGLGDRFVPSMIEAQEKLAGLSIVPRSNDA